MYGRILVDKVCKITEGLIDGERCSEWGMDQLRMSVMGSGSWTIL